MSAATAPHTFALPRRLDFEAMQAIQASLADRINGPAPHISADAIHTEYIDSMAVGILVRILKDVQHAGGTFTIRNLRGDPFVLFEETGLNKLFVSESNGEQAATDPRKTAGIKVESSENGGVHILTVSGPVSYPRAAFYLKEQILLALAEKHDILIDFLQVDYVDSSSIGEILQMHGMMRKTGAQMVLSGLTGIVRDAFENLSICRLIPCYKNVEQALASFAPKP